MPEYDFVVVGHSHAVAFLDGVTDWRKHIASTTHLPSDPRYSDAFQGWFSGAFPDESLQLQVTEPGLRSRRILARLIPRTSALNGAAEYVQRDGQPNLLIQPQFLDFLKGLPANVPIVSFIRGNEHARQMLGDLPRYDFLEPEVAGLDPAADAVPIDTIFIDQVIDTWLSVTLPTLAAIRAVTGERVIHILPPPPRENPQSAGYFEKVGAIVREHGFAPDAIRLKWYRRYCRLLSMALGLNGCEVLPPPTETLTKDGFLKSTLADGLTHAKLDYGKILARAIEEKIRSGK